jgi:hypothetical protein
MRATSAPSHEGMGVARGARGASTKRRAATGRRSISIAYAAVSAEGVAWRGAAGVFSGWYRVRSGTWSASARTGEAPGERREASLRLMKKTTSRGYLKNDEIANFQIFAPTWHAIRTSESRKRAADGYGFA